MWSSNVSLSRVPGGRTRKKPRVRSANTNIKAEHFSELMKTWFASWRLQFPTMIKKYFIPTYKWKSKLQNIKKRHFKRNQEKNHKLPWMKNQEK